MTGSNQNKFGDANRRWTLALIITILSISGIAAVASLVLIFTPDDEKGDAAQMVLTAVLPLLAAWVGTVLAYYYSSESLEAATNSVKKLVSTEEKLQAIPVTEVMIGLHKMKYFTYKDDLEVQAALDGLEEAGKGDRLPFLTENNVVEFIFHKSAIDEALVKLAKNDEDIKGITFKTLFEKDPDLKKYGQETYGIVGEDATLADANDEMNSIDDCQDVFVTEKGRKDGTVVGWITNGIIQQNSKL